jgi:uracil phosphoribosyltransferase
MPAKRQRRDDSPLTINLDERSLASRNLLSIIRNRSTKREDFVFHMDRLAVLVMEEALSVLASCSKPETITTPTNSQYAGTASTTGISPSNTCAVSILRSGDIFASALHELTRGVVPVGKVLIQRDESHVDKIAKMYWKKVPQDLSNTQVLLLDPMLATGSSARLCINELIKFHNADPSKIVFCCCICAPEGIKSVRDLYPSITIVTAAIDDGLNEHKYIVPGLGDAGDRYYGV